MAAHIPSQEIYEELLIEVVQHYVWKRIVNKIPLEKVKLKDENEYWKQIKNFAKKLTDFGKTPTLLIDSLHEPEWISALVNGYELNETNPPEDLEFTVNKTIKDTSYIGHFNEIEVHQVNRFLRHNTSIIIAKESFNKIEFTKKDRDQLVSVEVESTDDPEVVNLKFSWMFEVETDSTDALFLSHQELEDD